MTTSNRYIIRNKKSPEVLKLPELLKSVQRTLGIKVKENLEDNENNKDIYFDPEIKENEATEIKHLKSCKFFLKTDKF